MKKAIIKKILLGLTAIFVLGITAVLLLFFSVKWGVWGPLPTEEDLVKIQNATATLVYSSDDYILGKIFTENRTNARFEQLPNHLVDALLATEDVRFYEHEGVDKRSILRVIFKSILLGDESSGGGSTLTQQLAKNLFGRKDYSFLTLPVNKFKEIILARRLESIYDKDHILELYLNTVPFSDNTYGIESASSRFFNKEPAALQPEESAVLIGMLKASTYYNPRLHPDHALRRRNVVLHQMSRYNYITEEKYDSLKGLPLILDYTNVAEDARAPYAMVHIKNRARAILEQISAEGTEPYDLETDGLRIYTTLNFDMQRYAEAAMRDHMSSLQNAFEKHWGNRKPWGSREEVFKAELKKSISYKKLEERNLSEDSMKYYLNKPHPVQLYSPEGDTVINISIIDSVEYYVGLLNSGFFAMQPNTGAVLAWAGGLDQQFLPYDHVLAQRQAASTFKPFVYATALSQGIDPCEYIQNELRVYENFEDWAPANYNNEYGGYYSMKGALAHSINVAAVQMIFEVGINNIIAMARQLGISSDLPHDPSISLGTGSVSLYDMVQAYGVFANHGQKVEPYFIERIENAGGEVLYEYKPSGNTQKVLEEDVTQTMNYMLQAVVNEGTGRKLRTIYGLQNDIAGKTGTAQNYTDGWFIGYNPHIVAGVWVGASSPLVHFRTGTYGSGSAMALPVFAKFFGKLNRNPDLRYYSNARFPDLPEELQARLECPDFREENLIDKFFGIFQKEEGEIITPPKGAKEPKKDEKGFFRKIFGKKKKD